MNMIWIMVRIGNGSILGPFNMWTRRKLGEFGTSIRMGVIQMQSIILAVRAMRRYLLTFLVALVPLIMALLPQAAQALPTFARQTGQNCVACHTGGQFPELTPYGRLFKMTGYTIGERTMPLSVMGVASYASVANTSKSDTADSGVSTSNSGSDFYKNGEPILATGSLFIAGKVTDNIGAFVQVTHDPYASANSDGSSSGHTQADNMDIRFADRLIDEKRDLIYGVSLNNSPSVSDPWNTAAAWMQYVPVPSPGSHQFVDGTAPYPSFGTGGNIVGLTAYAYLDKTYYGELGFYGTADGAFRIFREGIDDSQITRLQGYNPYWRFAYTRDWGAHNLMIGTTGMLAKILDAATDPTDSGNFSQVRNTGIDAQYQYILDPHTFTAQLAYMQQVTNYSANSLAGTSPYFQANGTDPVAALSPSDTLNTLRLKLAYTYLAKYGGSVSLFDTSGTTSTNQQTSGYDSNGQITSQDPLGTGITSARISGNLLGTPGISGSTLEAFYLPLQNLRLGAQYTAYSKFNGASSNYDGLGRNASDNNTLFLYAWFAF